MSRVVIRCIVFSALLHPLLASEQSTQSEGSPTYVVSRVIDGDTVELLMSGSRVKVRLIGVTSILRLFIRSKESQHEAQYGSHSDYPRRQLGTA